MSKELATLTNVSVKMNGVDILKNISLKIETGEQWAIVGKSGSGKTTLAQVLTGRLFHSGTLHFGITGHIGLIEQQHRFKNRSNTADFYYQQRYNSLNADDTITVAEALENNVDHAWVEKLHLAPLLQEPLIQLSNGENKRLQLAKALLRNPAVLVMDNPFVGLDTEGRQTLHKLIDDIVANRIHIILITPPQDLPSSITHVAVLENGSLVQAGKKEAWIKPTTEAKTFNATLPTEKTHHTFTSAVKMINVPALRTIWNDVVVCKSLY